MPSFQTFDLIKWMHILAMGLGGGGALVALLLSGFEEERPDLRGLAATVWKRVCGWSFRLAFLLGIVLLILQFKRGEQPFDAHYMHLKIPLAVVVLALSEMTPKGLAIGTPTGEVELVQDENVAVSRAAAGAAFVQEQDGQRLVISGLFGAEGATAAARSYMDAEVVRKGTT